MTLRSVYVFLELSKHTIYEDILIEEYTNKIQV